MPQFLRSATSPPYPPLGTPRSPPFRTFPAGIPAPYRGQLRPLAVSGVAPPNDRPPRGSIPSNIKDRMDKPPAVGPHVARMRPAIRRNGRSLPCPNNPGERLAPLLCPTRLATLPDAISRGAPPPAPETQLSAAPPRGVPGDAGLAAPARSTPLGGPPAGPRGSPLQIEHLADASLVPPGHGGLRPEVTHPLDPKLGARHTSPPASSHPGLTLPQPLPPVPPEAPNFPPGTTSEAALPPAPVVTPPASSAPPAAGPIPRRMASGRPPTAPAAKRRIPQPRVPLEQLLAQALQDIPPPAPIPEEEEEHQLVGTLDDDEAPATLPRPDHLGNPCDHLLGRYIRQLEGVTQGYTEVPPPTSGRPRKWRPAMPVVESEAVRVLVDAAAQGSIRHGEAALGSAQPNQPTNSGKNHEEEVVVIRSSRPATAIALATPTTAPAVTHAPPPGGEGDWEGDSTRQGPVEAVALPPIPPTVPAPPPPMPGEVAKARLRAELRQLAGQRRQLVGPVAAAIPSETPHQPLRPACPTPANASAPATSTAVIPAPRAPAAKSPSRYLSGWAARVSHPCRFQPLALGAPRPLRPTQAAVLLQRHVRRWLRWRAEQKQTTQAILRIQGLWRGTLVRSALRKLGPVVRLETRLHRMAMREMAFRLWRKHTRIRHVFRDRVHQRWVLWGYRLYLHLGVPPPGASVASAEGPAALAEKWYRWRLMAIAFVTWMYRTTIRRLAVANLYVSSQYGLIKGKFQKALINQNVPQFWDSVYYGILWYSLYAFLRATIVEAQALVAMTVRYYLSGAMHRAYLLDRGNILYKITRLDERIPNADQRITQDADLFSQLWAEVYSKTLDAPINIAYYGAWAWLDRGFLGPTALAGFYVVLFVAARFLMTSLARLVFRNEDLEGRFRAHHVRIRDSAEAITFYGGHGAEHSTVRQALMHLIKVRWAIIWRSWVLTAMTMVSAFFSDLGSYGLMGYFVFMTDAFHGLDPGQVAERIAQVRAPPSSFHPAPRLPAIDLGPTRTCVGGGWYPPLHDGWTGRYSEMAGMTSRVGQFLEVANDLAGRYNSPLGPAQAADATLLCVPSPPGSSALGRDPRFPAEEPPPPFEVHRLTVSAPDGRCLVAGPPTPRKEKRRHSGVGDGDNDRPILIWCVRAGATVWYGADLTLRLEPGFSLLVTGPNGCGKSTLLRVLAGMWPFFQANALRIPAPPGQQGAWRKVMFLPQQTYLIAGTLPAQVAYPEEEGVLSRDRFRALMDEVGLATVLNHVDPGVTCDWSQVLSPGEQQLVAIARLLFHRPRWAVLDEATTSLSNGRERHAYELLQRAQITYISVGHRPQLRAFHKGVLHLGLRGEGPQSCPPLEEEDFEGTEGDTRQGFYLERLPG
ncbi:putative ATP-binding cassette sub-family D member 4 [Paratrimastix pyriformis]|uniref:ATP-binding cassette sub-family D member 4 n=1 Tax=Paratrimastix pyriformis TaxID=342808 RepID=A0ABQ8USM1_9EUKA|nr:putative ATP-binding cassette sub-family D member 4 [Paratrimastix pyriformis]